MLTTLVSIFLSIFSALRATPLYTGILTLGNGFTGTLGTWFNGAALLPLLESEATIINGTLSGNNTTILHTLTLLTLPAPPVILSLPSFPVLLTLPAAPFNPNNLYSDLVSAMVLLLLVNCTVLGSVAYLWYLRTATLAQATVNTKKIRTRRRRRDIIIDLSGTTYDGPTIAARKEVAGVPTVDIPAPSPSPTPTPARKESRAAKRRARKSSQSAPVVVAPIHIEAPAEGDDEGEWKVWTNRRRRRPPGESPSPPLGPLSVSHSRSSSFSSTSRSSDLFSGMSTASTALTSAPHSRRSSIATAFSSAKFSTVVTHPSTSITSHNRFSVLEVEGQ